MPRSREPVRRIEVVVEFPLQSHDERPSSPVVDSGEVHPYWAMNPTALVVRTGRRKLALTLTRSSRELMHALDALRGEEIVMLAERRRFIPREQLRGLACYLRHCRGLAIFKRRHGPVYHLTRYGWKELQTHLSMRWRDLDATGQKDLETNKLLPLVDLLPEPAEELTAGSSEGRTCVALLG